MNRRLASVLLAGFSVSVATGTAIALGNSVSTTPPPAFVRSVEAGSSGADDPGVHDIGDDRGTDAGATTSSTAPTGQATTRPTAPGTTVTTADDHGSGGHGADDPATHDAGDDRGGDDPATHDIGDDHGDDGVTTATSTPSTTVTTFDDPGGDDPATHDVGDDHGGDDGGEDGGDDRSGSNSGRG